MKNVLNTAPTIEPVGPQDLIEHSRIDAHEEDAYLTTLLAEGREAVEEITWRKLITQTWDQSYDGWEDPLKIAWAPVSSITSVTYVDADGDTQTLADTVYELGDNNSLGIVRRKYDQVWPTIRGHADDITVQYVCGYGTTAADVPWQLRAAIRIHAAHYWIHREGEEPLPRAFYDLVRGDSARRF